MSPGDPVTEAPRQAPTAGEQLRAARAARGWSVQDVASRLRIRPALVEALEGGDYAPFTAAAYARGQLRNYARLVGLDEQALLAGFGAPLLDRAGRALRRAPELHPRRPWLVRLGGLAIVGLLVVLGALWAGADRSAPAPAGNTELVAQPTAHAPVEPALPTQESVLPAAVAAPSAPSIDTPPVVGGTPAAAAEAVPLSAPGAEPAATAASEPAAAPAQAAPSSASDPATAASAVAELRLRSRAVSWVEVTDHRGQRLIYELVGPDRERVVSGAPPLRLLLGNAPAVDVVFAGQPVALPPGQHVVRMTLGAAPPAAAVATPAAAPSP